MGREIFLVVLLVTTMSATSFGRTWYIMPDGTGDAPTIQAGIDSAAAGDTVSLADGTHTDVGNWDIDYRGKAVTVRSESGEPEVCVIDCGGNHKGVIFGNGEDAGSVLEGVSIQNAWGPIGGSVDCRYASPTIRGCVFRQNSSIMGGGIYIMESASIISDCIFSLNSAEDGGAIFIMGSRLQIQSCAFLENQANSAGGAIHSDRASLSIDDCTFSANSAESDGGALYSELTGCRLGGCKFISNHGPNGGAICCLFDSTVSLSQTLLSDNKGLTGGAVHCAYRSSIDLTDCTLWGNNAMLGSIYFDLASPSGLSHTIVAFNTRGPAVYCDLGDNYPTLSCCNLYDNLGDWVGCIADQYGVNGNISEDPLFCNPDNGNFYLDCSSPCVHGYGCGQMGVYGGGCGSSVLESVTWGTIKSLYD